MNLVPIVLGLVVIIIAAIILINVFGGGKSKYELEISSQTIVVGETAEASIKGIEEGDEPDITWSSSDSNVVSVDPSKDGRSCTLNAEAVGSATVAAVVDGKENVNTSIVVVKTAPGVVRIELAEKEATVRSGDTYTIQAKVIMEKDDMSPANITWESNDASVARVENGVITAQDVGQAIIKATAGEQTAEFVVKVVENPSAKPNDGTQSIGQKPEDGTEPDTGTGTGSGAATGGSTGNTGSGSGGTSGGAGTPTEGGGNSGSLDSDITGQTPAAGTEE